MFTAAPADQSDRRTSFCKFQIIQSCNAVAIGAVQRRNASAVILCREVGPYRLIDRVELARTVHKSKCRAILKENLRKLGVVFLELRIIGLLRERLQDLLCIRVLILTEVSVPVDFKIAVILAQIEHSRVVRCKRSLARAAPHADIKLVGSHIGVINRCLREVSLNIDADTLSCCGNDFKRSIPVRPAARALCLEGEIRSVNLADAVAVGINDASIVEKLVGAVNIAAGKLIILQCIIVDVLLTQRIVRSNNAAGILIKGR